MKLSVLINKILDFLIFLFDVIEFNKAFFQAKVKVIDPVLLNPQVQIKVPKKIRSRILIFKDHFYRSLVLQQLH